MCHWLFMYWILFVWWHLSCYLYEIKLIICTVLILVDKLNCMVPLIFCNQKDIDYSISSIQSHLSFHHWLFQKKLSINSNIGNLHTYIFQLFRYEIDFIVQTLAILRMIWSLSEGPFFASGWCFWRWCLGYFDNPPTTPHLLPRHHPPDKEHVSRGRKRGELSGSWLGCLINLTHELTCAKTRKPQWVW